MASWHGLHGIACNECNECNDTTALYCSALHSLHAMSATQATMRFPAVMPREGEDDGEQAVEAGHVRLPAEDCGGSGCGVVYPIMRAWSPKTSTFPSPFPLEAATMS